MQNRYETLLREYNAQSDRYRELSSAPNDSPYVIRYGGMIRELLDLANEESYDKAYVLLQYEAAVTRSLEKERDCNEQIDKLRTKTQDYDRISKRLLQLEKNNEELIRKLGVLEGDTTVQSLRAEVQTERTLKNIADGQRESAENTLSACRRELDECKRRYDQLNDAYSGLSTIKAQYDDLKREHDEFVGSISTNSEQLDDLDTFFGAGKRAEQKVSIFDLYAKYKTELRSKELLQSQVNDLNSLLERSGVDDPTMKYKQEVQSNVNANYKKLMEDYKKELSALTKKEAEFEKLSLGVEDLKIKMERDNLAHQTEVDDLKRKLTQMTNHKNELETTNGRLERERDRSLGEVAKSETKLIGLTQRIQTLEDNTEEYKIRIAESNKREADHTIEDARLRDRLASQDEELRNLNSKYVECSTRESELFQKLEVLNSKMQNKTSPSTNDISLSLMSVIDELRKGNERAELESRKLYVDKTALEATIYTFRADNTRLKNENSELKAKNATLQTQLKAIASHAVGKSEDISDAEMPTVDRILGLAFGQLEQQRLVVNQHEENLGKFVDLANAVNSNIFNQNIPLTNQSVGVVEDMTRNLAEYGRKNKELMGMYIMYGYKYISSLNFSRDLIHIVIEYFYRTLYLMEVCQNLSARLKSDLPAKCKNMPFSKAYIQYLIEKHDNLTFNCKRELEYDKYSNMLFFQCVTDVERITNRIHYYNNDIREFGNQFKTISFPQNQPQIFTETMARMSSTVDFKTLQFDDIKIFNNNVLVTKMFVDMTENERNDLIRNKYPRVRNETAQYTIEQIPSLERFSIRH